MASPVNNVTPSVLWYYTADKMLNYLAFAGTMEEIHTGQATVSKYPVQKGFEVSNHLIRHNKRIQVRAFIPEAIVGGLDVTGANSGFAIGQMAKDYIGVDVVNLSTLVGGVLTDPFGVATNYLEGAVSAVAPQVKTITDTVDTVTSKVDSWFGTDGALSTNLSGAVNKFIPSTSRRIDAFRRIQDIQDSGYLCSLGTVLKEYSDLVLVEYSVPTTIDTLACMFVDLTFEQILTVDSSGEQVVNISMDKVSEKDKANAMSQGEKFFDSSALNWSRDKLGSLFS